MDNSTIERLQGYLIGSPCIGMEDLGNYLQLLLAKDRLIVQSPWRVIQKGEIVVGSGSDEDTLAQLPSILIGQHVHSVIVHGIFSDLRIGFEDGTIIDLFADSERYEHWQFVGRPQK